MDETRRPKHATNPVATLQRTTQHATRQRTTAKPRWDHVATPQRSGQTPLEQRKRRCRWPTTNTVVEPRKPGRRGWDGRSEPLRASHHPLGVEDPLHRAIRSRRKNAL